MFKCVPPFETKTIEAELKMTFTKFYLEYAVNANL